MSTIHFYIILKLESILYFFTSFSNFIWCNVFLEMFEYHTFLHHSQTPVKSSKYFLQFEYHTFLHHSQTECQTRSSRKLFEYHTFLHHSQTSNSKMKCHHSHKIQVLKLLGCYISHPSLSIIYLVTPSMQSLAQVSINKS